jgi:hypothetical protein
MPVNETASLERDLTRTVGVAVDHIFLNGLYPDRFTAKDEEALAAHLGTATGSARDAMAAALSVSRRSAAQHGQLKRLESVTRAPVTTLPFLFKPQLEMDELRELAAVIP